MWQNEWKGPRICRDLSRIHPCSNLALMDSTSSQARRLKLKTITKHVSRCFIAGIVALLPIGGTLFTIYYLETQIAGPWLKEQGFYFFGCGLIAACLLIYLIGLVISTFLGRWIWRRFDLLLDKLPLLGRLYQTLKQILGYGEGPDAVFRRVVLVSSRTVKGCEMGFVTAEAKEIGGANLVTVFLPGSPNPTTGRIVMVDDEDLQPVNLRVNDAMMSLVSVGALDATNESVE